MRTKIISATSYQIEATAIDALSELLTEEINKYIKNQKEVMFEDVVDIKFTSSMNKDGSFPVFVMSALIMIGIPPTSAFQMAKEETERC